MSIDESPLVASVGSEKAIDKSDLFERYKLLVAARNFHYTNFNKWLTYFYVANGAILVSYLGWMSREDLSTNPKMGYIILSIGIVAGLMLYWSSKGYYYWNINWIMLVNYYEKKLLGWEPDERIYSIFANKKIQNSYWKPNSGANFSTSKVAILFAFLIVVGWSTTLLFSLIHKQALLGYYLPDWADFLVSLVLSILLVMVVTVLVGLGKGKFLGSNTNPLNDLKLKQSED